MFARALAQGFLSVFLLCHDAGEAASADRTWPFGVLTGELEIGAYAMHQKSIAGVSETGTHVPVKWTRFHSDSLDWKFEGSFSRSSKRGDNWRSLLLAPGLRYRIDGSTSVEPFLRLGLARARTGARTALAYGADVLLQKTFTLDPQGSHAAHRLIILETQAGFMAYRGRGEDASARYGFITGTASYDWPFWPRSWNALHRKRAKIGFGVESQFGPDRAVDRLFLASLSLRREDAETGKLLHKVDLYAGFGTKGQHRVSLGYARGF